MVNVVIDEIEYKLVDGKAEVGDKIIVVKYAGDEYAGTFRVGDVHTVEYIINEKVKTKEGALFSPEWGDEYKVLVPVPKVPQDSAPYTYEDIVANLVRRVSRLEQGMIDMIETIEQVDEQIDRLDEQGATNSKDIRTWADDFTNFRKETQEQIESLTDDIVMLDERTQTIAVELDGKEIARAVADELHRHDRMRSCFRGGCCRCR